MSGGRMNRKNLEIRELAEELDLFDDMINALVELLEEKGILRHEEWEQRIKQLVERRARLTSYREVE